LLRSCEGSAACGYSTGRWADIGKFKVPSLRGLAMRPPYFHNGMAESLGDVLRFYRQRFNVRLSDGEERDPVAFLSSL
jgi:cytochrome c peroxidase